jgi:hypothetical protein
MNALNEVVKKLRNTGIIGLEDFKSLNLHELQVLSEEIQFWCVYCNGELEKLGQKELKH